MGDRSGPASVIGRGTSGGLQEKEHDTTQATGQSIRTSRTAKSFNLSVSDSDSCEEERGRVVGERRGGPRAPRRKDWEGSNPKGVEKFK